MTKVSKAALINQVNQRRFFCKNLWNVIYFHIFRIINQPYINNYD